MATRRPVTELEQKYFQEESDRLVAMIKNHPDANKGKPTPQAIKDIIKAAQDRLYRMGYRPTSQGLEMQEDDDPVMNKHSSNDDAWARGYGTMMVTLKGIQEKAAGSQ